MPDRRTRYKFGRRALVFAPAAIVLVTAGLAYGSLRRSLETRAWVIHTRVVLEASNTLLNSLLDAESAQRGYLLTRDTAFLSPYRSAGVRADTLLERLRVLTRDNPAQQLRLDTLAFRARQFLATTDTSVADVSSDRVADAIGIVARGSGRPLMDDVRHLIDNVQAEESRLLVLREASERRATELTAGVIIVGSLIAAIFGFFINRSLDRALNDRRAALSELEMANNLLQEQAVELEAQADAAENTALEAEQAAESAQEAMHAAEASERRTERLQSALPFESNDAIRPASAPSATIAWSTTRPPTSSSESAPPNASVAILRRGGAKHRQRRAGRHVAAGSGHAPVERNPTRDAGAAGRAARGRRISAGLQRANPW